MNIRIFLWKNNVSEDEIYEIEKFFQEEEIKEILNKYKENNITIPMLPLGRSLNLSNAVAVVLFEALRQNNFEY